MSDYLITREALDNFQAWVYEAQTLRLVLTDLINELRSDSVACLPSDDESGCIYCNSKKWPCDQEAAVRRAEERLKEITDYESD